MPAPYDYLGGVQPPNLAPYFAGIASNVGTGLAAAGETAVGLIQQRQAQQAQQEAAQAYAEDLADYSRNPSMEKFSLMLGRYPQMRKQLEAAQKGFDEERKKNELAWIGPTLSMLQGNKQDLAIEMLLRRASALENSDDPMRKQKIANLEAMVSAIKSGDEGKQAAIAALIKEWTVYSDTSDPAKIVETFRKEPFFAPMAQAETKKKEAEAEYAPKKLLAEIGLDEARISDLASQIETRAAEQGLKAIELAERTGLKLIELESLQTDVPDYFIKKADEKITDAMASQGTARLSFDLAKKIESLGSSWGVGTTWYTALKNLLGEQGEKDLIRKLYIAYKNKGIGESLKAVGGNDSDRDVALWSEQYPSENANPPYIASFLRGQGKAAAFASKMDEAQAEWISKNGKYGLGSQRKDINVIGFDVPAGMSFIEFTRKYGTAIFNQAVNEFERGALGETRWGKGLVAPQAAPQAAPVAAPQAQQPAVAPENQIEWIFP